MIHRIIDSTSILLLALLFKIIAVWGERDPS